MDIAIELVSSATEEVRELVEELNAELAGPYAADQRHGLSIDRLFQPAVRFFLARLAGEAVGCGGVAFLDGYAEVKRMYARPKLRGRGVAKALLARIEGEARGAGARLLRLETGVHQHEALRFYERAGFRCRGPFGPYAEMAPRAIELSLFYEKAL
jgi:putative acetyltransferase